MKPLSVSDLLSLEQYHNERADFRVKVLAHKKHRQVALGPNVTLYFEDRLTIQYQVQEMLRIERIFESDAIEEELAAYNPLIPSGSDLKATVMIEYPDVEERRAALEQLAGFEDTIYVQVEGFGPVVGIADEDLERSSEGKTSAVHFIRFEFEQTMIDALRKGAGLSIGSTHPKYSHQVGLSDAARAALIADFD
jgi:hypothetical protein